MYLWRRATAPPLREALARLRGGVVAVVGGHGAGPKQLGAAHPISPEWSRLRIAGHPVG